MDAEIIKMFKAQQEQINDLTKRLDNYLNGRVDETNENLEVTTDTLSVVMEDILPPQAEQLNGVVEAIDTLMTEILPSILE